MDGGCKTNGKYVRCIYNIVEGKVEGKISLGRRSSRWEGNMNMDLKSI
jgi:hypothetical protein